MQFLCQEPLISDMSRFVHFDKNQPKLPFRYVFILQVMQFCIIIRHYPETDVQEYSRKIVASVNIIMNFKISQQCHTPVLF